MSGVENKIPKNEYPRPQFVRDNWKNLNGEWAFAFDDDDCGIREKWFENHTFPEKIIVPFVFQCERSGINRQEFHNIVWYKRQFENRKKVGKRYILHFGAVDYKADIWVNGSHVMTHMGGHISFSCDITDSMTDVTNTIVVRAEDDCFNLELPRGKQFWKKKSENIFYTGTTGIWQTVWMEEVSDLYLKKVWMTPDIDRKNIYMEIHTNDKTVDCNLEVHISYDGKKMVDDCVSIYRGKAVRAFRLDQNINLEWEHVKYEWTPENPVLFDVEFVLRESDEEKDRVQSYFAMRKVSVVDGKFLLNNRPYYQKLILDQGYWKESLMTAPSDEKLKADILLSKEMGFNGARKHQKIEEERFYYWADKLGYLIWAEYSNAYIYSKEYVKSMVPEWMDVIDRDYNHPSIIVWVPLNESWGIDGVMNNRDEQAHSESMYHLTKSLDQTRLVISNDGWNHTKSDLLTIHDYRNNKKKMMDFYQDKETVLHGMPTNRTLFAQGYSYDNQPIIVSEFGGICYKENIEEDDWGYSNASSGEEFMVQYAELIEAMLESPEIQGFVYTQLSDVEQETNGLLTYERERKISLDAIKKINDGVYNTKD